MNNNYIIIIILILIILLFNLNISNQYNNYNKIKSNKPIFYPVYQNKMIFYEIINFKSLNKMIKNYYNQKKMDSNKNECDCTIKLSHSLKIYEELKNKPFYNNGILDKNTYKILKVIKPKNSHGNRCYPLINSSSLFYTSRIERKALIMLNDNENKYIYKDIDIQNCFPTLCYNFAKLMNIKCGKIYYYINNRENVLKMIQNYYNIIRYDAKLYLIAILFGGTVNGIYHLIKNKKNQHYIYHIKHHPFLIKYSEECCNVRKNLLSYLCNFDEWEKFIISIIDEKNLDINTYETNRASFTFKSGNVLFSKGNKNYMSYKNLKLTKSNKINNVIINETHTKSLIWKIYSACENQIIMKTFDYINNQRKINIDCIIHDGLFVRNNPNVNWDKLLIDISKYIKNEMNINIYFSYKDWEKEDIHPLYNNNIKCKDLTHNDKKYLCDSCCRKS